MLRASHFVLQDRAEGVQFLMLISLYLNGMEIGLDLDTETRSAAREYLPRTTRLPDDLFGSLEGCPKGRRRNVGSCRNLILAHHGETGQQVPKKGEKRSLLRKIYYQPWPRG